MSEQIASVVAAQITGPTQNYVERRQITRYEVWHEKTVVLRTVHEVQALRYAHEIQGEVRSVTSEGFGY
jgi:hypothetical protein